MFFQVSPEKYILLGTTNKPAIIIEGLSNHIYCIGFNTNRFEMKMFSLK